MSARLTRLPASILFAFILLLVVPQSGGTTESGSATDDTFVIRYCVHEPHLESYLFIYSNGTAEYRMYSNSTHGNWTQTWTGTLSSGLISEAFQTMNSEDFMTLNSSYEDYGWPDSQHTERACIDIAGVFHTVSFQGRSMMGVIPGSFAILNNIGYAVRKNMSDIPDATLSITVTKPETAGPLAIISASFTNKGDSELYDTGLCNSSWPTFVVSANGTTVGDLQGNIYPECLMIFPARSSEDFGPWEWNRSGLAAGEYVIMSRVVIWSWVSGSFSSDATFEPNDDDPGSVWDLGLELGSALILAGVVAVAALVILFAVLLKRKVSRGGSP